PPAVVLRRVQLVGADLRERRAFKPGHPVKVGTAHHCGSFGRRTTDDGRRTTDDRRQTTDDGWANVSIPAYANYCLLSNKGQRVWILSVGVILSGVILSVVAAKLARVILLVIGGSSMRQTISLAGQWQFQLDPAGTLTPAALAPDQEIPVPLPWQAAFP